MDVNFDVNKMIEEIANGLHVATEKVYPVLYKQAILDGVMDLVWVVVLIAFLIAFYKYAKFAMTRLREKTQEAKELDRVIGKEFIDHPVYAMPLIFGTVAAISAFIGIVFLLNDSATALFNTDYYVIKDVLSHITGK